jgi:hypothetical protein
VTVTPVPTLTLDGTDLAAGPNPDGTWPPLMVLDGATVTWGREEALAQPKPATATVSVFDPDGGWAASRDLIGLPITLRWTAGGTTRTYFTGRVGAVTVTPTTVRAPDGNRVPGATVRLACTSLLADLANRRPPSGGWPAETLAARRTRIAALVAGPVAGIGTRPAYDLAPLAPEPTPAGGTVLAALEALLANAGADRWTYDPDTRRIDWLPRRRFDPATAAHLARDSTRAGVYVTGPAVQRTPADPVLPAVGIPAAVVGAGQQLTRDLASRITRATVTWADPANGYNAATVVATVPGTDETLVGVRSADLSTQLADLTTATTVAADAAALAGGEAAGWALPAMRWATPAFPELGQALLLLSGCERPGVFWLAGSQLPTLGVLPLFGVMGGQIGYRRGGWDVTWHAAPTGLTAPAGTGIAWDDLDPTLTWGDPSPTGLDDSVTYEDMRWVTTGAITIGA